MSDAADNEWLFDAVANILQSPAWEGPIFSFIDMHCHVFANQETNEFGFTEIHNEFRDLVDRVVEEELERLGITPEEFAKACEASRDATPQTRAVFDQLTSLDDFLTFKKLMVRRNEEHNAEVLRVLSNRGPIRPPASREEEEELLRRALEESAQAAETVSTRPVIAEGKRAEGKHAEHSGAPAPSAPSAEEEPGSNADVDALELLQSEHRLKLATLEHEIAHAVQVRQKRIAELKDVAQAAAEAAVARSARREAGRGNANAAAEVAASRAAAAAEGKAGEAKSSDASPRVAARSPPQPRAVATQGEGKAAEKPRSPTRALPPVRGAGAGGGSAGPRSPLPPLGSRAGGSLGAKKSLDELAAEHAKAKQQADELFAETDRANRRSAAEGGAGQASGSSGEVTDSEIEARRQYLERQRQRLLALKQAKREEELAKFRKAQEEAIAQADADAEAAIRDAEAKEDMTEADRKRMRTRARMMQRMKLESMEQAARDSMADAAERFESLENKIREAKEARRQIELTEAQMQQRMRARAAMQVANASASSYGMRR